MREKKATEFVWPADLAEFDPERFTSKAEWHLARCRTLPKNMKLAIINEIRMSTGRDPL